MKVLESHRVDGLNKEIRLSDYVAGIFQLIPSRKGMKKAIQKGLVRINGERANSGRWIQPGDQIDLLDDERAKHKPVFELSMPVVFEDEHCAVIAKPAGYQVNGYTFQTVENALPFNLKISSEPDSLARPLPVHRLDFPTTGLLMIAKTSSALRNLKLQFEHRLIDKSYQALVRGRPVQHGHIFEPIEDKSAHSEYRVLDYYETEQWGPMALLTLNLFTGRRHQLRKHLAGIGHAIVGDPEYGTKGKTIKGRGLFLHARSLSFNHPVQNSSTEKIKLTLEPPRKFQRFLQLLQKNSTL